MGLEEILLKENINRLRSHTVYAEGFSENAVAAVKDIIYSKKEENPFSYVLTKGVLTRRIKPFKSKKRHVYRLRLCNYIFFLNSLDYQESPVYRDFKIEFFMNEFHTQDLSESPFKNEKTGNRSGEVKEKYLLKGNHLYAHAFRKLEGVIIKKIECDGHFMFGRKKFFFREENSGKWLICFFHKNKQLFFDTEGYPFVPARLSHSQIIHSRTAKKIKRIKNGYKRCSIENYVEKAENRLTELWNEGKINDRHGKRIYVRGKLSFEVFDNGEGRNYIMLSHSDEEGKLIHTLHVGDRSSGIADVLWKGPNLLVKSGKKITYAYKLGTPGLELYAIRRFPYDCDFVLVKNIRQSGKVRVKAHSQIYHFEKKEFQGIPESAKKAILLKSIDNVVEAYLLIKNEELLEKRPINIYSVRKEI